MEPDLVIATGALGPPNARQMLERLDIDIIWLPKLSTPEELLSSIKTVSERLSRIEAAEALIEGVNRDLAQAAKNSSNWAEDTPTVLFLLEPPGKSTSGMGGGLNSKADTLIRLAGGMNIATRFSGFKPVSAESLVAMNPAVILVGQSDRHGGSPESIQAMIATPSLSEVSAIKKDAVYAVPLDDLAFGPRLGEVTLRWNSLLAKHAAPVSP
jgi:iron complex transport system substrate-binding protein